MIASPGKREEKKKGYCDLSGESLPIPSIDQGKEGVRVDVFKGRFRRGGEKGGGRIKELLPSAKKKSSLGEHFAKKRGNIGTLL